MAAQGDRKGPPPRVAASGRTWDHATGPPWRRDLRLLFVCTGNVCRSPVAQRLATAWARDALAHSPEADGVHVLSAGLTAVEGRQIDPASAHALAGLGGDPAGFGSQPFNRALAEDADPVLTRTRGQRRTVL